MILLAGIIIGIAIRSIPWRRGKLPRPRRAPALNCGCGDHHAMHDPKTGQCHATEERPMYENGSFVGYHDVQCTCRQYSGPEPLPEYVAREIG